MGRIIRTREGFVIDSETGEVIDDKPFEFLEDLSWNSYTCFDEESVERIINSIVPGLVEILKLYLRKSLCSSRYNEIENVLQSLWGSSAANIVGKAIQRRLEEEIDVYEAKAYNLAGLPGLSMYRCFRKAGYEPQDIIKALSNVIQGSANNEAPLQMFLSKLFQEVRMCRRKTLVRWVSKPLKNQIDVSFAATVLNAEIRTIGRLKYITTKIDGFGVQITANKVDVSSKASEVENVLNVLSYLSRRLGVELSKPLPMVATIVIKLPFRVNINVLAAHENGEVQGKRAKITRKHYTILAYPTTVNIYAKLDGFLDKIESIVAEALPIICTYMEK
ncbi:hypothetical protein QPL79_06260 [Ignisphaera sp. 4213-co]|uniref:Uncharacterized protein n=1 Tax=Ignisphaera cupida TaxID=3050454 RepID=A0ABD4Z7I2_9CREN|nr:hypothetical protein [Ignisphaera sp. 4213-co]MDK6028962.1 hypothetical protein [Ignisphaera sp. 4213-co]